MSQALIGPKLKKDMQQTLYNLTLCLEKIEKAESCDINCEDQRRECEYLIGFLTKVLEKYAGGAPGKRDG